MKNYTRIASLAEHKHLNENEKIKAKSAKGQFDDYTFEPYIVVEGVRYNLQTFLSINFKNI